MTLLETIAVLVILSGVVTVSLGMIGPMSAAANRRDVITIVESFFDRTRLLSMQSGGAVVTAGESLIAIPVDRGVDDTNPAALVITRLLPAGWSCHIREEMNALPLESLPFSGSGTSDDCIALISNQRGDVIIIERLGASGQMRVLQDVEGVTP